MISAGSEEVSSAASGGLRLFQSWQFWAGLSAVFAALTAIFGKMGVAGLNSNFATFVRTVVILVIVGAVVWWRGEWQRLSGHGLAAVGFLIASGIATGLSWLCYYRALQLGPASKVAPVDKLSVILVIGLGVVFLGEPLSWRLAIGGGLILAGVVLVAL